MAPPKSVVEQAVVAHMGRWFGAGLTGCKFATPAITAKTSSLVVLEEIDESTPATFNAHLAVAAEKRELALFILPLIDDESKIVGLIRTLATSNEWTYSTTSDATAALIVDLRWKKSSIIGFGPFPDMPVTRRSPFAAMAAWPCGHDNKFRRKPDEFVGVGDMEHEYDADTYKSWKKITVDAVTSARSMLPGGSSAITGISFRLPAQLRADF